MMTSIRTGPKAGEDTLVWAYLSDLLESSSLISSKGTSFRLSPYLLRDSIAAGWTDVQSSCSPLQDSFLLSPTVLQFLDWRVPV